MSMMNFDLAARSRRMFGWPVMLGSGATAGVMGIAVGLLGSNLLFSMANNHPIAPVSANFSQPVAALEPATFRIAPSPVIEANAQFFYGAGDGSSGYYAEQPNR